MADVLAFWAAALVVAAFGYPIGAVLLRRLPDGGAGVALPLGLVLASYGYFILRVLDLLDRFDLRKQRVAVAVNAEVVPKSRFAEVWIRDGDKVEVIHAVGGGA